MKQLTVIGLLSVVLCTLAEQTPLSFPNIPGLRKFEVLSEKLAISGFDRVSEIFGPGIVEDLHPIIFRSSSWNIPLNDLDKETVKRSVSFRWADKADMDGSKITFPVPEGNTSALWFRTRWHVVTGRFHQPWNHTAPYSELITAMVPDTLVTGGINGYLYVGENPDEWEIFPRNLLETE
ncbi:hypothetical protein BGZ76_002429 [Entomortierella beljakovae]|nr:hypothetical protein BGZ76_002429 [Entomortierella beljakovae]